MTWRERFEKARDMEVNRSIYRDRPSADPAAHETRPTLTWRWYTEAARIAREKIRRVIGRTW